jgi:hypothetical protein
MPQTWKSKRPAPYAAKWPASCDFWTAFTGGEDVVKITVLILVLLGLATASGAAMIASVRHLAFAKVDEVVA